MARILVVDGNDPVRFLLAHLLCSDGHQVEQATDGCQALAQFDDCPFDLVLMDACLSCVDGLEICRRLRSESKIPILILSTSRDPGLRARAIDCGANAFLHKPVKVEKLLAWVRTMARVVI